MTDDDGAYLGDIARPGSSSGQEGEQGGVMSALTLLSSEQGELRAEVRELREQVGDLLQDVHQLGKSVTALSGLEAKVLALADSVDQLLGQGTDEAVRPVDLAHIPPEEEDQVLADLVTWVRDTVFSGWPWTQERLRACWVCHPDLINRMLWLKSAYAAAYDDPRARPHSAADWHRWLDDVMDWADQATANCPAPEAHEDPPPPRDDLEVMRRRRRAAALAQVHRLMQVTARAGYPADQVQAAQRQVQDLVAKHGITEDEYRAYVRNLRPAT